MTTTLTPPVPLHGPALADAADQAVREVLLSAVYSTTPATIVAAPPGAGKTGTLERVAALGVADEGQRIAILTQTNATAWDVLERLARAYPMLPLVALRSRTTALPEHLDGPVHQALTTEQIPGGPTVLVGNAAKWSYTRYDNLEVDLLIVDEAFQMPDYLYAHVARLAPRHLLIGDPGQIAPVITTDTRAWEALPDGPQQPAPTALAHRRPDDVAHVRLPATRRLGGDTAGLISPSFYPTMPFGSLRRPTWLTHSPTGDPEADGALEALTPEQEIVPVTLPAQDTGPADPDMPGVLRRLVLAALAGTQLHTEHDTRPVRGTDIGISVAHVSQVAAVQAALGPDLCATVAIDTTERWQGREVPLMLVWHPLSGRPDLPDFNLDAGRLCVALSRHTAGALLVHRACLARRLHSAALPERRNLHGDTLAASWHAQTRVLAHLANRTVTLTP